MEARGGANWGEDGRKLASGRGMRQKGTLFKALRLCSGGRGSHRPGRTWVLEGTQAKKKK